jgi:hypothetical protein
VLPEAVSCCRIAAKARWMRSTCSLRAPTESGLMVMGSSQLVACFI